MHSLILTADQPCPQWQQDHAQDHWDDAGGWWHQSDHCSVHLSTRSTWICHVSTSTQYQNTSTNSSHTSQIHHFSLLHLLLYVSSVSGKNVAEQVLDIQVSCYCRTSSHGPTVAGSTGCCVGGATPAFKSCIHFMTTLSHHWISLALEAKSH